MIETEKRVREAVRYLGFGRNEADERTLELIQQSFKDLEQEGPRAEICVVRRDLVGCPVWDSLQQALDTVRKIPFTRVKAYKNSYLIHSRNADLASRL